MLINVTNLTTGATYTANVNGRGTIKWLDELPLETSLVERNAARSCLRGSALRNGKESSFMGWSAQAN
jgi:hypothetical protein